MDALVVILSVVIILIILVAGFMIYSKSFKKLPDQEGGVNVRIVSASAEPRVAGDKFIYSIHLEYETSGAKMAVIPVISFKEGKARCKEILVGEKGECDVEIETTVAPAVPCRRTLAVGQTTVCNGIAVRLVGFLDTRRMLSDKSRWLAIADLFGLSKAIYRYQKRYLVLLMVDDGQGEMAVKINLDKGCRQAKGSKAKFLRVGKDSFYYIESNAEMGGCYGKDGCEIEVDETCSVEMAGGGDFENGVKTVNIFGNKVTIKINSLVFERPFAGFFNSYILKVSDPYIAAIEDFEVIGEGWIDGVKSPIRLDLYPQTCIFLDQGESIDEAIKQCGLVPVATARAYVDDNAEDFGIDVPEAVI